MKERLSSLDTNFWNIDSPSTNQTIGTLCILDGLPDKAILMSSVARAIELHPRMKSRVIYPNLIEDKNFNLDEHVIFHSLKDSSEQNLIDFASSMLTKGIDKTKPLWKLVVAGNKEKSLVYFIFHHSFADGVSGLELFSDFCDEIKQSRNKPISKARAFLDKPNYWESIKLFIKDCMTPIEYGPLTGINSSNRKITLREIPLARLTSICAKLKVSINDLMLSLVAVSIRDYYKSLRLTIPTKPLRAVVPVSRRLPELSNSMGNKISGLGVSLYLTEQDVYKQAIKISSFIKQCKTRKAYGSYSILASINSALPSFLVRIISEFFAKQTSFICTNVTASYKPRHIGGAKVTKQFGLAAPMRGHGVTYGFMRLGNKMCVGLVTDPDIVSEPELLADLIVSQSIISS